MSEKKFVGDIFAIETVGKQLCKLHIATNMYRYTADPIYLSRGELEILILQLQEAKEKICQE